MPLAQLPDGRWRYRYYSDGTKRGERRSVTLPAGTTHAEALNHYRKSLARASARAGRVIPGRITVETIGATFCEDPAGHVSKSTLDSRRVVFSHVTPVLGSLRAESLRPHDVERYQKSRLKEGAAPATINHEIRMLRQALRAAVAWRWIDSDPLPARTTQPIRERRAEQAYFTPDEWNALLAHAQEDVVPMLRFLLFTGARVSEACAATWSCVDLEHERITLAMEKLRGRPKSLPLVGALKQLVESLPRGTPAAPLLTQPTGAPWNRTTVGNRFREARTAAGIREALHVHSIRHSFASHLIAAGVPLPTVSKMCGHSSLAMTLRYVHLDIDALRDAMDVLPSIERNRPAPVKRQPV